MTDSVDLTAVMSIEELLLLRKSIGLTQPEMAEAMGLSKSAYVAVETGTATMRKIHQLAAERVALSRAAELRNPTAVPGYMLREIEAVHNAAVAMTEDLPSGGFQQTVRSGLRRPS